MLLMMVLGANAIVVFMVFGLFSKLDEISRQLKLLANKSAVTQQPAAPPSAK